MSLSTSLSKNLFGVLVVSLALSYLLGAAYTLVWNPEILFWKQAYAVKVEHAKRLDATGKPKTVFVGGSSCAFQIDPKILDDQFSIASVNMGMHAGMGARVIVALALPLLKPGDHLVLNMEPGLLTGDLHPTPLGLQFLASTGNIAALASLPSSESTGWIEALLALRPGLRNLATMSGKLLAGRPPYRYGSADIQYGGHITTEQKGAVPIGKLRRQRLSASSKIFLDELKCFSAKQNLVADYLLPWICVKPENVASARSANSHFTADFLDYLPEIKDGRRGVDSHIEDFADTPLHMTSSGATRRTVFLGPHLR